ncbi:alpha/beta fold hydrolase [Saccharopolyspora tripterygii]
MPRTAFALPGTFCAPMVFEPLQQLLDPRFEIRALSWMTDAEDRSLSGAADWVAGMIPEPALVVGHSTGGAIALQLAATHPELVSGLMLLNTGPNMKRHGDVTALIEGMERNGTAEVVDAVLERSFRTAPPPDDLRRLRDYGRSVPLAAALEALRSQHAVDLEPELSSLRMPVSIVHGRFDPVRTVDVAEGMAEAAPDSTLRIVEAGHSPMYEVPDAVADALDELGHRVENR